MPILFVLLGPTAVGKTALSLHLAEHLGSPILSADSRQMFRDIPIGTAAPTPAEQKRVAHHFVGTLDLEDYYSAAQYEQEALALTDDLFHKHRALLVSGGSMMYIDALCQGIDDIPTIIPEIRAAMLARYEQEGLPPLLEELERLDPEYASIVDPHNHKRVIHALEVITQTGQTLTSFRQGRKKERPFRIVKIGLNRPRPELFDRINLRTSLMVEQGFIDEARRVMPYRHCNSLNTVGFKEMFQHLDGEWALDFTLDRIRKNTRVYAKKQLTWFQKDSSITWFHPDDVDAILTHVDNQLSHTHL